MASFVSMDTLIGALRAIPPGDPCDPDVIRVMRQNRVAPEELLDQVVWNAERYTRHLVFRDERYQIILLGWGIGQVTPVHDHAGQRCWMSIEVGRLQISDYCWKDGAGAPRLLHDEVVGGKGAELHLDRCACVHQIANPDGWNERAVSLHVYSKPFAQCGVYCLETGKRGTTDLEFDSVGPHVCDGDHAAV